MKKYKDELDDFVPKKRGVKKQGRHTRHDEEKITTIAIDAIIEQYGSLKDGFIALLESKDPPLVKWVFEHAAGKPKERIDIDVNKTIENVQVIRLPHNNRDNIGDYIDTIQDDVQQIAQQAISVEINEEPKD
jgi:hypothetical protein